MNNAKKSSVHVIYARMGNVSNIVNCRKFWWMLHFVMTKNRAGLCCANTLYLHSGDTCFESPPDRHPFRGFPRFFHVNVNIVSLKDHDRFLPNPIEFAFINHRTIRRCVVRDTGFVYNYKELIPKYDQQHATLHSFFISVNCSTCFGRIPHTLSGAHTTVFTTFGNCQTVIATCR